MATTLSTGSNRHRTAKKEAKFLFAIGFVYFLAVALVLRLAPPSWRSDILPSSEGKGIWGQATEAAHSLVGFAFMH